MQNNKLIGDLGFIITKAPLESSFSSTFLELAINVSNDKKSVGFFLISDGVFFVKKNQKNNPFSLIKKLQEKNVEIIVSKEHLESAGISDTELIPRLSITNKSYDELVDFVMEKYRRVITL